MGKASQKHLQARMSYLFDAALYFRGVHTSALKSTKDNRVTSHENHELAENSTASTVDQSNFASSDHIMISHMRSISTKATIRMDKKIKHQICKRCNAALIPFITSTRTLENKSKGGKKPWATVEIISCNVCGVSKRFPIGAKPQLRKTLRSGPGR